VIDENEWVPLAEVARPHGVKGELRLKLFNKDSNVLLHLDEVLVRFVGAGNGGKLEEHEVSVDRARRADDAILLKLHSVDDRDRADELRSALICVRRKDFPEPEPGEFYTCDILGAKVVLREGEGTRELGTVREIQSYPTVDTLCVRASDGGNDWEIPLVEAFVESVDAKAGLVIVATLEGVER
jgi:16S rRNA processing protein RimM